MGGNEEVIPSLATSAKQGVGKIQNVELLGAGKLPFTQDESGLEGPIAPEATE